MFSTNSVLLGQARGLVVAVLLKFQSVSLLCSSNLSVLVSNGLPSMFFGLCLFCYAALYQSFVFELSWFLYGCT